MTEQGRDESAVTLAALLVIGAATSLMIVIALAMWSTRAHEPLAATASSAAPFRWLVPAGLFAVALMVELASRRGTVSSWQWSMAFLIPLTFLLVAWPGTATSRIWHGLLLAWCMAVALGLWSARHTGWRSGAGRVWIMGAWLSNVWALLGVSLFAT